MTHSIEARKSVESTEAFLLKRNIAQKQYANKSRGKKARQVSPDIQQIQQNIIKELDNSDLLVEQQDALVQLNQTLTHTHALLNSKMDLAIAKQDKTHLTQEYHTTLLSNAQSERAASHTQILTYLKAILQVTAGDKASVDDTPTEQLTHYYEKQSQSEKQEHDEQIQEIEHTIFNHYQTIPKVDLSKSQPAP